MSTTYIDNKRVVANNNNSHNNNNNNSHTTNNNNKRNPLATNTPKKPIFQDAVVAKSDVGEFQGGYFIMSSNDEQKIKKPVSQTKYSPQRKRLPTVNQLNNVEENSSMDMKALKQQQQQQYLQIKNRHQQYHQQFQQQQFQQDNNNNNTESILITPSTIKETNLNNDYNSPKKLNTSNNRIVSPQSKHQYGTSPPRSNSPTKNGKVVTSPSTNWAAGKWSNSPAANTLPVLDFDDFFSGSEEVAPTQQQQLPPQFYHQQQPIFYHQPPPQFYHHQQQYQQYQQQQQPQPIEQPNLESMSNQLKMLLNIDSTVAASTN